MCKRPEICEVEDFLKRHDALIVHFSGAPKGSGTERRKFFPHDLTHVVEGKAMGGVACSVVCPHDIFGSEHDARNAIGCIGVVLALTQKESLVAVDADDVGSGEDEHGNRVVLKDRDIEIADLEKSLSERTCYNEWVVRDYEIRGIFAVPPFEVSSEVPLNQIPGFPENVDDCVAGILTTVTKSILASDVVSHFPDAYFFTFRNGTLVRCTGHEFINH